MPVSHVDGRRARPAAGHAVLELAAGPGDLGFLAAELIQPGGTLISSRLRARDAHRRAGARGGARARRTSASSRSTPRSIDLRRRLARRRPVPLGLHADGRPRGRAARDPAGAAARRARSRSPPGPGPRRTRGASLPSRDAAATRASSSAPTRRPRAVRLGRPGVIDEHARRRRLRRGRGRAVDFTLRYADVDDWWAPSPMSPARGDARPALDARHRERRRRDLATRGGAVRAGDDGSLEIPAPPWVATAERVDARRAHVSTTTTPTSPCSTARPSPSSATAPRATPTR